MVNPLVQTIFKYFQGEKGKTNFFAGEEVSEKCGCSIKVHLEKLAQQDRKRSCFSSTDHP